MAQAKSTSLNGRTPFRTQESTRTRGRDHRSVLAPGSFSNGARSLADREESAGHLEAGARINVAVRSPTQGHAGTPPTTSRDARDTDEVRLGDHREGGLPELGLLGPCGGSGPGERFSPSSDLRRDAASPWGMESSAISAGRNARMGGASLLDRMAHLQPELWLERD